MFKQTLLEEKVPVYTLELEPSECRFDTVAEIVEHFKKKIQEHPTARYLTSFDHYTHTSSLPNGQMAENIKAATNVVFCFGLTLPDPIQLANRPRSIGICQTDERFIISFMEAPMPVANTVLEDWAKSLYAPLSKSQTA